MPTCASSKDCPRAAACSTALCPPRVCRSANTACATAWTWPKGTRPAFISIEIKAGLVPFGHVHAVAQAVFADLHTRGGQSAVEHAAARGQSFELAHVGIRTLKDAGATGQF